MSDIRVGSDEYKALCKRHDELATQKRVIGLAAWGRHELRNINARINAAHGFGTPALDTLVDGDDYAAVLEQMNYAGALE